MTQERRFADDEVAKILDYATAPESELPTLTRPQGPTLSELQEIGAQAGIAAERIAEAARRVLSAQVTDPAAPTFLGAVRSVERTVRVERALTDEEWGAFVADLRATFDTYGSLEGHGLLRTWVHDGVHVHGEPTSDGYQIRMQAEATAASSNTVGITALLILSMFVVVMLATGNVEAEATRAVGGLAALLASGGVGLAAYTRRSLPVWKANSERAFDGLARRLPALMKGEEDPSGE